MLIAPIHANAYNWTAPCDTIAPSTVEDVLNTTPSEISRLNDNEYHSAECHIFDDTYTYIGHVKEYTLMVMRYGTTDQALKAKSILQALASYEKAILPRLFGGVPIPKEEAKKIHKQLVLLNSEIESDRFDGGTPFYITSDKFWKYFLEKSTYNSFQNDVVTPLPENDALDAVESFLKSNDHPSNIAKNLRVRKNKLGTGYFIYVDRSVTDKTLVWYVVSNLIISLNDQTQFVTPFFPRLEEAEANFGGRMMNIWEGTGLSKKSVISQAILQTARTPVKKESYGRSFSLMEQVFIGKHSKRFIKGKLERAMKLYKTPLTEEFYHKCGSALVALRKNSGIPEMEILSYMIDMHSPSAGLDFATAAAFATTFMRTTTK